MFFSNFFNLNTFANQLTGRWQADRKAALLPDTTPPNSAIRRTTRWTCRQRKTCWRAPIADSRPRPPINLKYIQPWFVRNFAPCVLVRILPVVNCGITDSSLLSPHSGAGLSVVITIISRDNHWNSSLPVHLSLYSALTPWLCTNSVQFLHRLLCCEPFWSPVSS